MSRSRSRMSLLTTSGIKERPIPHWQDIKLTYAKNKYPVPLDPQAPRMFFVGLFVGSRGSGKTHAICQLLKQYERTGIVDQGTQRKVAQRVIVFSPTIDANPVFTSLGTLDEKDVHTSYTDSKLLQVIDDIKHERSETVEYQRKLKIFRKFLKCKPSQLASLTHEEVTELERMDYDEPPKPTYPDSCVVFMVLDDLIGSAAFKSVGRSALTELVLKNRHLGVNILIATQNLKAIPKSIRTNTSLFVVYRFASKKVISEDLYEEVSNSMTLPQFEALIEYATEGDHNSLVIDFSAEKDARFKKNFDRILSFA